jgi:hypothetical protein
MDITTNPQSILGGTSIISQLLISIASVVILFLAFATFETTYNYLNRMAMNRTELLPITYATEDKTYTIIQNPNDQNAKPVYLSDNERTGPEFTYSFYMNVHPTTFRQEYGLLHIFHKGTPSEFPLLGPGVFMRSDTNTLRIYMNTFKTWNCYCEVENIPVGKWVHCAVVCKARHLEIYINGNLAKRLGFDGYLPYQNYQNICAFSQRRISLPKTIPSLDEQGFEVFGVMKGMISRLYYFNYALSYTEITSLVNQGPSSQIATGGSSIQPPYLDDTWWTSGF